MGWEILYNWFTLKKGDGIKEYYVIHGSNNCWEHSGKRERNVSNIETFPCKKKPEESLVDWLKRFYEGLKKENSGFEKGIPKTFNGFLNKFINQEITEEEFMDNGEQMEIRLIHLFRKKREPAKTTFELDKELEDKPFIKLNEIDVSTIVGKTLLPYNESKHLIFGKGKIKAINHPKAKFGFFKSRSNRRFYYLSDISYVKLVRN